VTYRILGRTGIRVSVVSFGAGPVSGLMTGADRDLQLATVARALELGINWFDTAQGYGDGRSEESIGRVLAELGADDANIATKVRVPPEAMGRIADFIRQSVAASLKRLRRQQVTLLQLHNAITLERDSEPSSITPLDVLGPVTSALTRLRQDGLIRYMGLTGTGEPNALREVIRAGPFDTLQVPFNILNPSAGTANASSDGETDYGNIITDCAAGGLGVFAIRVFAGGALLGRPPSEHTRRTRYFPLSLYERDLRRTERLRERVGEASSLPDVALRFVLSHPAVSSAIIGFGSPTHLAPLATTDFDRPLPNDLERVLRQ
jgi:aryl-alcohol dehydrogenase-like predicted oxidoreductase